MTILQPPASPQLEQPLKLTVSFTAACNLACRHCYARCNEAKGRPELTAEQWRRVLDEAMEAGVISFYFEGGEPFARTDFLEILGFVARRALTRVRTNGTLMTVDLARRVKSVGVAGVYVDLMGARPDTHDWFTGVEGSFERTCEGVRALEREGVPVTALIVLTRQNAGQIQEFLELSHGLGAKEAAILRLYPIGRARESWARFALTLNEQMDVLAGLRHPKGLKVMQSWHPNNGNCCWQMAAVNPWGDSIGCAYLREFVNYGNVLATPFLETWRHPLYQELRAGRVDHSCGECSRREGTHGGCRATAFAFHGRWDAPDPFDEPLNDGIDLRELPGWMLQESQGPQTEAGS